MGLSHFGSAAAALALALLSNFSTPAFAQEGTCDGVVSFGEESDIRLMEVQGAGPRVNFIDNRSKEKPGCPAETEACKRKGFVVPGDQVLALAKPTPMPCVSYIAPGAKRVKGVFSETSGFLPAAALRAVPVAPKLEDWAGTWSRSAEAEITLSVAGGRIKVAGQASWGALDPGRVKRGAVNIGELEGEATPKGNRLALGEGYDGTKPFGDDRSECRARLRLFGRYLVVEDNGGCGGMNVSFTGLYVRLAR